MIYSFFVYMGIDISEMLMKILIVVISGRANLRGLLLPWYFCKQQIHIS